MTVLYEQYWMHVNEMVKLEMQVENLKLLSLRCLYEIHELRRGMSPQAAIAQVAL